GSCALITNGSSTKSDALIQINGGKITSDSIAIYQPGANRFIVTAGTITGSTALYVKSGKVDILGGIFNATGDAVAYTHNDNGAVSTGDALVVENCSYPGGKPKMNVEMAEFNSAKAKAVASYDYDTDTVDNPVINNFIKSGLFSSDVSDLVVSGRTASNTGSGMYAIAVDTNKLTANTYRIEGYQKKISTTTDAGNDINTHGVRIFTRFSNTIGATDYGYVVAKYTGAKTVDNLNFSLLTDDKSGGNGQKVISCKDTYNKGVGFGDDYVTLAVNGMSAGDKVVARFYAVVDGVTYYSDYISAFGNANSGILAEMS
ncbi:MAG: hypothetical protein IJ725_06685, partial [Ruminococcus sp.]|nr:hypothetical protein [Ruminococcus sp.]